MSHSFPPPEKRRPWWKFKTTAALLEDRKQYRSYLTTYNAQRAAHSLPAVKRSWFARHKVLSSIAGFFVFLALIAQCGEGTTATVAEPLATSVPPAATSPSASPTPTGPSEAELAAAAKKAADEEEQRKAQAAAKKAAEEKKAKAAAAKKKAAAKEKREREEAAERQRDREAEEERQREQEAEEQRQAEQDAEEEQDSSVYYENCAAVRAAGKAPIRVGEPGYADHLDRDGDGQGCGAD